MTLRFSVFALVLLLSIAVAFVLFSAASLPPIVASHFVSGGAANGFMSREGYISFMLVLIVGIPLLLVGLSSLVRVVPARYVSLPNRNYWLSPERSTETISFIQNHARFFAVLMVTFLCFVHWLVVRANAQHPPLFPERLLIMGMLVFAAALAGWLGVFIVHFRRP